VPRLVYQLAVSQDQSLHGYVNSSLSHFDVRDFQERSVPRPEILHEFQNVTDCRYVLIECLLYHIIAMVDVHASVTELLLLLLLLLQDFS